MFDDNLLTETIRAMDTGKGPTKPGRYLALDGAMIIGLTAFMVGETLTWTWDDQPTEPEDLWTDGWACAPTVLSKEDCEEIRGRLDAASGCNFDDDETEWWCAGWKAEDALRERIALRRFEVVIPDPIEREAFETRYLSIGDDYLSEHSRAVREGGKATAAYYEELADQAAAERDEVGPVFTGAL